MQRGWDSDNTYYSLGDSRSIRGHNGWRVRLLKHSPQIQGTYRSRGGGIQITHTILWETQGPQRVIMVGDPDDKSIRHRYKAHIGP